MRRAAMILALSASIALADQRATKRSEVDAKLAESMRDIKSCGAHAYKGAFDWRAYDALDWSKQEHTKTEWVAYELATVGFAGEGIDHACKSDPDCKVVLGKIDTIGYQITDDENNGLTAKISGRTLTFLDYAFGSTRTIGDWERAALQACESGSLEPDPDAPKVSAAWDGKYAHEQKLEGAGSPLCHPEVVQALVVSGGKFSFPWYVDDWNGGRDPVAVGHVDGEVHADGTTSATVTWEVRYPRVKQQVEKIGSIAVTFKAEAKDKVVRLSAQLDKRTTCESGWALRATAAPAGSSSRR